MPVGTSGCGFSRELGKGLQLTRSCSHPRNRGSIIINGTEIMRKHGFVKSLAQRRNPASGVQKMACALSRV